MLQRCHVEWEGTEEDGSVPQVVQPVVQSLLQSDHLNARHQRTVCVVSDLHTFGRELKDFLFEGYFKEKGHFYGKQRIFLFQLYGEGYKYNNKIEVTFDKLQLAVYLPNSFNGVYY